MTYLNKYYINRPIYSYESLSRDFKEDEPHSNFIKAAKKRCRCKNTTPSGIGKLIFPLPFILKSYYKVRFLLNDLIAGLTMLVFHIPQGMAYGSLSGLQPINGLYASFFPPLVYAFFGTSRHLSIGTFSLISLLSRESVITVIDSLAKENESLTELENNFEVSLRVSVSLTLMTGIIQFIMGLCSLGFIMEFLSDALIDGFTTAAAFHVLMAQIEQLLGFNVPRYSGMGQLPYKVYLICKGIQETNVGTIVTSLICIFLLLLFSEYLNPIIKKKIKFPFPIQFALVIFSTLISYLSDINKRFGIDIIGEIPSGIPAPTFPDVSIWSLLWNQAFLLAILGFVMNGALCKIFSLKFGYDVNFNQELTAYGMGNIVGSLFDCVMSAAALARTSVVVEVGIRSQIASLISCFCMLFVLLFIGPLFKYVPTSVLAAIIVVSLKGLFKQFGKLTNLWHISYYDFFVWIVTFLAVFFCTIPIGIGIGFIFSILVILLRLQLPKSHVLGQIPDTDIYRNIKIFKEAREIPGIKIIRYDAPLYFANSENFLSRIYHQTTVNPHKFYSDGAMISVKSDLVKRVSISTDRETVILENINTEKMKPLKYVIIDFSAITFIDNVGVRVLDDIYTNYRKVGIRVFLACADSTVRHMLRKSNFAEENLNRILFVSIHDAVLIALQDMTSDLENLAV